MSAARKPRKGIGGPSRSPDQRLRDRAIVAEAYLQGYTIRQIADRLGISKSQAHLDLEVVRAEWRASATRSVRSMLDEELAKINRLEIMFHEGYARSMRPQERHHEAEDNYTIESGVKIEPDRGEEIDGPGEQEELSDADKDWERMLQSLAVRNAKRSKNGKTPGPLTYFKSRAATKKSVSTEHRDGDLKWLDGVRWCIEMRLRLLATMGIGTGHANLTTVQTAQTQASLPGPTSQPVGDSAAPFSVGSGVEDTLYAQTRRLEESVRYMTPAKRVEAIEAMENLQQAYTRYEQAMAAGQRPRSGKGTIRAGEVPRPDQADQVHELDAEYKGNNEGTDEDDSDG